MDTFNHITEFTTRQRWLSLFTIHKTLKVTGNDGSLLYVARANTWFSWKRIRVYQPNDMSNPVMYMNPTKGMGRLDFQVTDPLGKVIGYIEVERGLSNSSNRRFLKDGDQREVGEFTDIISDGQSSKVPTIGALARKLLFVGPDHQVCADVSRLSSSLSFFVDFNCKVTPKNTIDTRIILACLIAHSYSHTR